MIQRQGCSNTVLAAKYNRYNFYSLLLKLQRDTTRTKKMGCLESLRLTANLSKCTACTLHLYKELIRVSREYSVIGLKVTCVQVFHTTGGKLDDCLMVRYFSDYLFFPKWHWFLFPLKKIFLILCTDSCLTNIKGISKIECDFK